MIKFCKISVRSATLNDFWSAMKIAYYNYYSEKPRNIPQISNITEMMYPWIEQNFYPIVHVERLYSYETTLYTQYQEWYEFPRTPVTFITGLSSNSSFIELIPAKSQSVRSGLKIENGWMIPNLQQTGKCWSIIEVCLCFYLI